MPPAWPICLLPPATAVSTGSTTAGVSTGSTTAWVLASSIAEGLTDVCLERHISAMVATAFEVLAELTRRRILDLLLQGERPVGELVAELGVAPPNVSKHLRALSGAGLVRVRPDGQRRIYALRMEPLRELDGWLAPYRRVWADRLDALERHLDEMEE